jgi:hypothetical protein
MIFFKRKKIVIDAFTYSSVAYNVFPIEKAIKFTPDYWKKLPVSQTEKTLQGIQYEQPTLKRCDGFKSLYTNGFIVPLWTDIILESLGDSWAFKCADDNTGITYHPAKQMGEGLQQLHHAKILSPWIFKEKTGVNFLWMEPTWNSIDYNYNLRVVPGVLDFKYQVGVNINVFFPKIPHRIELDAGIPIAHLIPLSENEIDIRNHLISKEEYEKIKSIDYKFAFIGGYKKKIDKMKCPFHR